MTVQKPGSFAARSLLLCLPLVFMAGFVHPQVPGGESLHNRFSSHFMAGINFYRAARWLDAAAELRAAQEAAETNQEWAEALYWVVLTELAASDYGSALQDMDDLEKQAPRSGRNEDMVYHRARAYYYLGYYDEAIVQFRKYADQAGAGGESRKAAALYWIGECLFAMGQLDLAADCFNLIVSQYPGSVKYEAATYRLDLIKQKKIEIELLALLKWSHEESLRTVEEYRRREKTYDQALNAYQKRLTGAPNPQLEDLENANADYQRQLAAARERIQQMEQQLGQNGEVYGAENQERPVEEPPPAFPPDDELKLRAQRLRNEIQWDLDYLESEGGSQ
jgi:TolA-binding protein